MLPFSCLPPDEAAESVHQTSSDHQQQQQQLVRRLHAELTARANPWMDGGGRWRPDLELLRALPLEMRLLLSSSPLAVAIETHECNCELVLDWWREQFLRGKALFRSSQRLSSQQACFCSALMVLQVGRCWFCCRSAEKGHLAGPVMVPKRVQTKR